MVHPSPASPAARPIIASTVLDQASGTARGGQARAGVRTGCRSIDRDALGRRGFEYGRISVVSGAPRSGTRLLAMHALMTHLIRHRHSQAALIDTTGSVSPVLLHAVLHGRLQSWLRRPVGTDPHSSDDAIATGGGSRQDDDQDDSDDDHRNALTHVLDRIKVMRVFDFQGVLEAVDELRSETMNVGHRMGKDLDGDQVKGRRPSEIDDSEAEDDDGQEGEEDEDDDDHDDDHGHQLVVGGASGRDRKGIGIIVVDVITNVVSTMMNASQVQGMLSMVQYPRCLPSFLSSIIRCFFCATGACSSE